MRLHLNAMLYASECLKDNVYFRAIHGKAATPKLKSWADIVKKPAPAAVGVVQKLSSVQAKPVKVSKASPVKPATKVSPC